jgi:transcriptional regulator
MKCLLPFSPSAKEWNVFTDRPDYKLITYSPAIMYTPKLFQNTNEDDIKSFIRHNGFGILVSKAERLLATHIPLALSEDGTKLSTHLSRGNPQWKSFSNNEEVLAIFSGPHSYISSSWYDHENVPTWNYIAVHAYGTLRIIEGDELYQSLKVLVDKYEQASEKPVTVEGMSQDYVKKEMRGIVGLEISITKLEATYKLSQNRDKKNYQSIIHELEKKNEPQSSAVAEAMKKNGPPIK